MVRLPPWTSTTRAGHPLVAVAVAAGLAGGLVACSGNDSATVAASDQVFAGLDRSVVAEVLASKVVAERVAGDDADAAAARYQNIVRNFVACRSALSAYQQWVASGVAPQLAVQPRPTHPSATSADMDRDIQSFEQDLASGDITLLRASLTNPSGCGHWIPAAPGDEAGPTISDVVNGKP